MNTLETLQYISVIIPSLDPNQRLLQVVSSLQEVGFSDIILVDDGSKPENKKYFPHGDGITLLVHEINRGKGAALKTALKFITENRPKSAGAVTVDGDGQHLAKDAKAVCEKMLETGKYTLGVRDFSLPDVPKKSRIGNRISAVALGLVSGVYIRDTQTGLRAIPATLLEGMKNVRGERFEYETNTLLELKAMGGSCGEVIIDTVYLDDNKGTHFRPFSDTVRIASLILSYVASSFASFLVDIGLFTVFHSIFNFDILSSTVVARVCSSVVNFFCNKTLVFHSKASYWGAALRYYALAVPVALCSAFGVKGLALLFRLGDGSLLATLLKLIVDTALFLLSFRIQKSWVFPKHRKNK